MHHPVRLALSFLAYASALVLLSSCSQTSGSLSTFSTRLIADTQPYLGGTLSSWNDGEKEAGFTLPLAVIERAPTSLPAGADPHVPDPAHSVRLQLPPEIVESTFLDHIEVDYNPVGHEPDGIYSVPHFDFHFYAIPGTEQAAIDCSDTTPVPADRLPPNYLLGKPGLPPEGECVPRMGIHAVDLSSPELRPEHPEPFARTMILGYYKGSEIFIEPMVTRDQLLTREGFALEVPRPPLVGRATRYPTRFTAEYDPELRAYHFSLSGFRDVQ